MLFKVKIVKLIDVFYFFNFSSVTAAAASSPLCLAVGNTFDFPVLKKSATIAAARHLSAEHFDPRQQAQLLNESITKQAETITQIAKKQGKTERMLKKNLRFFKGQSAGSSSRINLNPDDEEDSENDDDDDLTNLSDFD